MYKSKSERTLVLIKPDGIEKKLIGEQRFVDFSESKKVVENLMHSSSTKEEAEEEISLFFDV